MKSVCWLAVWSAAMLAAGPLRADELDDLLTSQPVAAADGAGGEPADGGFDFARNDPAGIGVRDEADPFPAPQVSPEIAQAARSAETQPAAQETKPGGASDFRLVPEPSAIILGILALGYFLVFGRRRYAA